MQPGIFGHLPNGEPVAAYTLVNRRGASLQAIAYGGIVTALRMPDRNGDLADVVLGFDRLEPYLAGHPYFGAIVGRVAGRIGQARFALDGKTYPLTANEAPNHLHGGVVGFDKRLWTATPMSVSPVLLGSSGLGEHTRLACPARRPAEQSAGRDARHSLRDAGAPPDPAAIRFTYRSPAGEEGYPGNVDVAVTYALTDENEFIVEAEATADAPTPLSLTHHSYFNLAGEGHGTIEDHTLQIHADKFAPADARMTLAHRLEPVAGRGNDFTRPRRLGDTLPLLHQAHGDTYRVRGHGAASSACDSSAHTPPTAHASTTAHLPPTAHASASTPLALVARVTEPASGRALEVRSTHRWLQFYSGVSLDGSLTGKSGRRYGKHAGFCLECQGFPDAANAPALDDIILRPGQTYRHTTVYAFSIA